MQSPPFPRYLVPPRSKYSSQHQTSLVVKKKINFSVAVNNSMSFGFHVINVCNHGEHYETPCIKQTSDFCQPHMSITNERPEIPPTVFAANLNDSNFRVFSPAGEWETPCQIHTCLGTDT